MELRDFLHILRRRIGVIIATVLVCVVAAGAYVTMAPRTYESTTTLFVATTAGDDPTQLLQGGDFAQQRVKSYVRAITSQAILEPVIADLGLDTDVDGLRDRITAFVPAETVLIQIAARDSDPVLAAAIAEAVANEFIAVVPNLEGAESGPSPVTVTVMEAASEPEEPVTPRPRRDLLTALAIGLGLGVVLAVVRHATDTRIDDDRGLGELAGTGVVATLPHDPVSPDLREAPEGVHAEAFRSLRTNLHLADGDAQALTITSAIAGEGVTYVAVNLARAVALTGTPVCILEANFKTGAHASDDLGLSKGTTISELLTGQGSLDDAVPRQPAPGWYVIPAGSTAEAGVELLASDAMMELLGALRQRFPVVIVDAPPLLDSADATLLGRLTGRALVVVRSRHVRRSQLTEAMSALDRAEVPVVGVVLNGYAPARDRTGDPLARRRGLLRRRRRSTRRRRGAHGTRRSSVT
jgi:polysaccharide biosynthesis transport protein